MDILHVWMYVGMCVIMRIMFVCVCLMPSVIAATTRGTHQRRICTHVSRFSKEQSHTDAPPPCQTAWHSNTTAIIWPDSATPSMHESDAA